MIANFAKFHNNPIRGWKAPAEGAYGSLPYTELKEPGSNRPFTVLSAILDMQPRTCENEAGVDSC